jgi:hypothetical protein
LHNFHSSQTKTIRLDDIIISPQFLIIAEGRRKKEEGRRKKEEGRRKRVNN